MIFLPPVGSVTESPLCKRYVVGSLAYNFGDQSQWEGERVKDEKPSTVVARFMRSILTIERIESLAFRSSVDKSDNHKRRYNLKIQRDNIPTLCSFILQVFAQYKT